jgi:hypothetical protein
MKKTLIGFDAATALLTSSTSSATSGEMRALLQQIAELNARLNALEGNSGSDRMHKQSGRKNVVHSRNDRVKLTVGGYVSAAVGYADYGAKTGVYNVTNNNSTTRGHFIVETPLADDVTVKSIFEFGYRPNNSSGTSIRGSHSDDFDPRRTEFS